jgi:hypothetical protein
MKRPAETWRIVLAACLMLAVAHADEGTTLRNALQAEYAAIVAGFRNNDPEPWISRLTPDFELTLFSGQTQDRKWVIDYVRNNAKTFNVTSLEMTIGNIEVNDAGITAVVEQRSSRTFVDDSGVKHTLDVGAVQRETWTKTADGYRLRHVQEKDLLYLKKDGK